MKKVSYKEYQKEINKKKKNTNNSKKNNIGNTKSTNSSGKKETIKNTTNKNNQNTVKKINTSTDIKKEKDNIPSKTISKQNNTLNMNKNKEITTKQKINKQENKNNLETIIEKEELNSIIEDNDIKILNDKELNQIIKSYEKDIKKETPKKKKRRIRWNNVTLLIFILIFLSILIISSTKIIEWIKDSSSSEKEIIKIQEETEVIETETTEETEIIETPEEEKEIPKTSPYWTYIEMNLIDVDFTELKEQNSDVAGWIQVNGTNINYPYVQTKNNEYYLTHSFDKTTNSAGWVFMDYRNNKSDFDKNTIIYAHSRKNNTMFGTLRKILKNGWLNNTNNHVIKLSTETENTLWQVFSVYRIPTTNDYIQVSFVNDQEFINFGEMLIGRSAYNFNTPVSSEDKILTLSTCYDDYDKVVLHAKLIKREKK